MKKVIKATSESLLNKFLSYHDNEQNYHHNPSGFDKMYEILEKYDDSNGNDTVDVAFRKATPEDQQRMIELIAPGEWALRPGEDGYARKLYYDALEGNVDNRYYGEGIVDAIEALFAEGWLNEEEFRTDL